MTLWKTYPFQSAAQQHIAIINKHSHLLFLEDNDLLLRLFSLSPWPKGHWVVPSNVPISEVAVAAAMSRASKYNCTEPHNCIEEKR